MAVPAATDFFSIKQLLRQSHIAFTEDAATGRLEIDGPDDYLIELDPARGLCCLFGVDMAELRLLVSGASNEDLGEDELQRVAREQLRPLYRRYQSRFAGAGFMEDVMVDAHSYAVAFVKSTAMLAPDEVVRLVQWCRNAGGSS